MNDKRIVAVMPLKLVNERLPGKNTLMLGDKPLFHYELNNLLQIDRINEIYVYCSTTDIESMLPKKIMFLKRPEYLDLPTSNFTQIFEQFVKKIDADIYIYAHATAPFITVNAMQKCLDAVESDKYDSAFCATKIQDFLWQDNLPLNFEADNIPRSQDLKPIYRETSGIYVFRKDVFEQYHRRIGKKPYIYETSYKEAIDINTIDDFKLAEALLNMTF